MSCCTASILHLCVIAVERYLAIAHPLSHGSGSGRMSRRRALLVIAGVWTCSAAISFAPIYAGWFADLTSMRLYSNTAADCGLHVNRVYAVVSSMTSFYLPLVVMVTVIFHLLLVVMVTVVMVTVVGRRGDHRSTCHPSSW